MHDELLEDELVDARMTTRDRQVVAIAVAHVAGDADRVDALARDHLVDHPDSVLVAWITANTHPNPLIRKDPS